MYAHTVVLKLPAQLAHGLKKRQALDVAHGAADLGDDKVKIAGLAQSHDVALDFVGDVRDNLHGLAQIIAAAFLVDYALIDATGGHIVGTCGLDIGETLVVAEVEVGLMAVHCHIALAVLIGIERTRVNIDVRVKLLDCDFVTAGFQQTGER